MENEKLKEIVWATCQELAPQFYSPHQIKEGLSLVCFLVGMGFEFRKRVNGLFQYPCRIEHNTPCDSIEWWIAAKLLDIPTEMPIKVFEADIAARHYQHELDEARREGFEDAVSQKLTSPEQELCAMIRDGLGKIKFVDVGSRPSEVFDTERFGRLFDAVMMGESYKANADAKQHEHELSESWRKGFIHAVTEKLTCAERELCTMIRESGMKLKKAHYVSDNPLDEAEFMRLFEAVRSGNGAPTETPQSDLSTDAELVLKYLDHIDLIDCTARAQVADCAAEADRLEAAIRRLCIRAKQSLKEMLMPSKIHRYRTFIDIMGVLEYWLDNEECEVNNVPDLKHFRAVSVAVESLKKAIMVVESLQDSYAFTHTETRQHPSIERINPSDSVVFVGACQVKTFNKDSQELWINCGEMGMLKVWSQTENGGIGKPIHHLYCEHARVTIEMIAEHDAKAEFTAMGGKWVD